MIELLLETGIRRGELLKLYTTDINQGSQHAYVSINDREHDVGDPRAEEPALKTHGRTVGISAQLYEVYERYIQGERRPLRNGKPMKLPYRYLFISDRGRPLSIRALSNVLDRLFLTIELAHPGLLPTLSAHDFRHTLLTVFWLTWLRCVSMTSNGPQTNSDESAVGLILRRCHAVMQVVI
nr:site-specific integrase [Pseudomonas chlororaphis]